MRRFAALPLFWQVYVFVVLVLVGVVGLTEFLLEPWVEALVLGKTDMGVDWYEMPVWAVSILVPSLACGLLISRKLTRRLSAMAEAARSIARGDLAVRLPEGEGEKNAFNDLARSFNHMADTIARQLEVERRLLADISHELRSPLARMAVAAELLGTTQEPDKKAATLRHVEKEIHGMGELVAQLLAQGRERNLQGNAAEAKDFAAALGDIVDDFRFLARKHGITIQADQAVTVPVPVSPSPLRAIIGNILDNAVFYSPSGGHIAVAASIEGKHIRITIRDHGPGVPAENLPEIFRAFYRVDASRARESGGAGLGLALARAEAIRLGGDITAENADPGLLVTVTLPLPEERNPTALPYLES